MTLLQSPTNICCVVNRKSKIPSLRTCISKSTKEAPSQTLETALIPAGIPVLGTKFPRIPNDGEELRRTARIKGFRMTTTAITNAQFELFVEATGYKTEAERFGWSFVFWSQIPENINHAPAVAGAEWWRKVDGANWRCVAGPGSEAFFRSDHPVVHISWHDATAFADWIGGRLPNEAEWEHAARGGLGDVSYPWGTREPDDDCFFPCNIWQGKFPEKNIAQDGHLATAPARSFKPNRFGLYNMVGNVWEWTSEPYKIASLRKAVRQKLSTMKGYKLLKGGSFLCHRTYCWRYRIPARSGASPNTTLSHQGFRVIFDL
ncbi:MAG: formylglycine-generating enzyme family protein [Roseibium sp.]|uniref:formylglycine-generating enzyme family protein n=1 Tax=Roseibium sp. TaxID=1936156 RepID=UPI0026336F2F|nr:formylglycine-generating enzyme family protein [Roseibium sp.]MCV0426589.1 formylglycine-generating enzyme family protein [Roseibium sp.]